MKTLLTTIILLAGINCFGQVHIEYDIPVDTFYFYSLNEIKKISIQTILEQYSEYEKECYNDSTAQSNHVVSESDPVCYMTLMLPVEANYCTNPNHYNTIYTHKKPGFADFMKWLESKYESNQK